MPSDLSQIADDAQRNEMALPSKKYLDPQQEEDESTEMHQSPQQQEELSNSRQNRLRRLVALDPDSKPSPTMRARPASASSESASSESGSSFDFDVDVDVATADTTSATLVDTPAISSADAAPILKKAATAPTTAAQSSPWYKPKLRLFGRQNGSAKSESVENAPKASNFSRLLDDDVEAKEPALARFATRIIPERPFSLDVADDTAAAKLAVPEQVDLAFHYEGAFGALSGTNTNACTNTYTHMHTQ
jgi:hypothetical protein